MGMCATCRNSKVNNGGTWCKYAMRGNVIPGDCGIDHGRYESIYTIEPTIVLGSRYYTPAVESGQYETELIVFQMEEEE